MNITTINTIETSSICDNRCDYCPAKDQSKHRPVGFMSMNTFEAALEWVRIFAERGTQRELNLFGVGEPTLHPEIVEMVRMARKVLPGKLPVHLNTNGNRFTEELAWKLKDAGISEIDVTAHNARATAGTVRILKAVGIPGRISFDPILQPNNWAGQVDWFHPLYSYPCPWLHRGQVMVMSDGRITRCCIDAFARGILGHVLIDNLDLLEVTPFSLCEDCHQTTPEDKPAEAFSGNEASPPGNGSASAGRDDQVE